MKHVKKQQHPKLTYIKIYTTPELVSCFSRYARLQGRSASRQGEFLIKQALLNAQPEKRLANG